MTQKAVTPGDCNLFCFSDSSRRKIVGIFLSPRDRYLGGGGQWASGVIPHLVTDHKITPLYLQVIAGDWGEAGEGGAIKHLLSPLSSFIMIAELRVRLLNVKDFTLAMSS